jgi:hypothetical protein
MRSQRALLPSAVLGVAVVVAAGISGTIHFAGARWVPDWKIGPSKPKPTKLPSPPAAAPPRIPPPHGGGGFPVGWLILWIIIGIAVIVVATMLWRWLRNRPLRESTDQHLVEAMAVTDIPIASEPGPEPDTPILRTGIELALQVLDEQREPADAIVRAWLGLQETAEESGIVRRPSETPTEFTSRILSRAFVDDRAVRTLLRLYLRARFGDHPVTSEDVTTVRTALQELVRTWPASDSPAGTGPR